MNPYGLDECLVPTYHFSMFMQNFMFKGCGGNSNNFASKEECEAKCHSRSLGKESAGMNFQNIISL